MTREIASGGRIVKQTVTYSLTVAAVAAVVLVAFTGGTAAHDDDDGLTVHNQTGPLDEHGEIHTLTIDRVSADTDYYVDVHTANGTINKTQTFDGGTTQENFQITLDPTITSDTEVTVALHAANGTELVADTISVDVVEAPTVSFSDQVHQLDDHDEVHDITVDTAAANEDYYLDVHTDNGTINTTRTFDGGTAQTDIELTLDPTLTETTNVTAAVHAENGTELAAETATVATADVEFSNQTHELDEHGEIHHITVDRASAGVPYYVDVHTDNGTINTTQTFAAETTMEDLELELSPTITSDTEVNVALHTEDGTEIAASTATVRVDERSQMETDNTTATEMGNATATEMGNATETATGGSGPGFGVAAAVAALLGIVLLGRYGSERG